jgi:ribosome-binding protein aMBF1 (putative translation factor)
MRKCKKCGQTKKFNEFKIERGNLTGYSLTLCADCHRINEKTRYRNKNKDTIIAF